MDVQHLRNEQQAKSASKNQDYWTGSRQEAELIDFPFSPQKNGIPPLLHNIPHQHLKNRSWSPKQNPNFSDQSTFNRKQNMDYLTPQREEKNSQQPSVKPMGPDIFSKFKSIQSNSSGKPLNLFSIQQEYGDAYSEGDIIDSSRSSIIAKLKGSSGEALSPPSNQKAENLMHLNEMIPNNASNCKTGVLRQLKPPMPGNPRPISPPHRQISKNLRDLRSDFDADQFGLMKKMTSMNLDAKFKNALIQSRVRVPSEVPSDFEERESLDEGDNRAWNFFQ
eukprot:GDKK01073154.1.p1 GENE.GDKK01073154.1~~GDKK01073154.1.p1  ORF type:complete len:313 (+),score=66.75 GDKK01073154.1:106-939(+)